MTKNTHQVALFALATALVLAWLPRSNLAQSTSTNASPESQTTKLDIPKAEFDDSLPSGRDPFFPKFQLNPTTVSTNVVRTASSLLVVKGMSVRGDKRLVVIGSAVDPGKSWSFEPGDEREIILANSRVKLKCDEIRDEVVVVSLGTPPQRIELPIPKMY